MSSDELDRGQENADATPGGLAVLLAMAAAVALVHIATNGRYGFHRDELQVLSDARHMDWGFVAYPPLTPFLERIGLSLFGLSLVGLRMFSVLAQAIALVVAGLIARELGGGRWAQVVTLVAVAFSPPPMFQATEFQYSSFDLLWWVLAAYFVVRLLKSQNPRWWIALGITLGIGLQTKYSIVFYIAGIFAGLLFTSARRWYLSRWLWAGVAIAILIFLPNFLWLVHHDFISYHFLQYIHKRDVGEGRAENFLLYQPLYNVNLAAVPLALAGLILYFRSARYRMVAWMYVVPVAIFFFSKGRFYYVAGVYPMLLAMGATGCEQWLARIKPWISRTVQAAFFAGIAFCGAYAAAIIVPIASSGPLRDFALKHNGDLREEIGWPELVKTVASIRDSLPPAQQSSVGILAGNYGEAGAIEMLGPAYHLPTPICTTNSEWLRGYPTPPPTTLIVVGYSQKAADRAFTACRLAGHNGNAEGVRNEESQDHPDIFVCGPPRKPWPEFWRGYQWFG